jgi:hypothetical protein
MAEAVTNDSQGRAKLILNVNSVSTNSVSWSATVTDGNASYGGYGYSGATLTVNVNGGNVLNEANKSYDFGGSTGSNTIVSNAFFPKSGVTFSNTTGGLAAGSTYNINATFSTTGGTVGSATVSFSFTTSAPPASPAPSFSDQTITTTWIKTINFSTATDRTVAASNTNSYSIVASGTGLSPTAWLTINSSGQLSGLPTALGVYTFVIRASGSGGNTDSSLKTLTVNPPGNRSNGTNMATDLVIGKRYNGTQWVDISVFKRYSGTAWVDIVN